jgi:hypothetical protein
MPDKTEADFVEEMKDLILDSSEDVSRKVISSALKFIKKKNWVNQDCEKEFTVFLGEKMPRVIGEETSKRLNNLLGLDL